MGMFGRNKKNDIVVKMDELPSLTEDEQLSLVEINDANVVSRLTSAVPGAAQAIANTATAMQGAQLANAGVYMAKIPTGAQLVNSQEVEGAVRGFFRDAKGIKGQANFLSVEGNMDKIAAMNIANAAMGAASLVVGQYYMKQINEGLATVNAGIAQINDFQDAEYKSKVLTLMTQVKRMSDFKTEIMDNSDIRKEEISRLQILEKECMELLSQAMDVARKDSGELIIMELGDGQVSGLQQIDPQHFYCGFSQNISIPIEELIHEDTVILAGDPMANESVNDVRSSIQNALSVQDLVDYYVMVHNKFWFVEDNLYDFEKGTPEYEEIYKVVCEWEELMNELDNKIMNQAEAEGLLDERKPNSGTVKQLERFMDKYGYRNGSGWWVKK